MRMRSGVLSVAAFIAASFFYGQEASSQDNRALHMAIAVEDAAKQSNSGGDWRQAGQSWLSVANSLQSDHDLALLAAKRALACLNRSYSLSSQGDTFWRQQQSEMPTYMGLKQCYNTLAQLEPNNPSWYYLYGELEASRGYYMIASENLKHAFEIGHGQVAGEKAGQLLTHITPMVKQDQASLTHDMTYRGPGAGGGSSLQQIQRANELNANRLRNEAQWDQSHGFHTNGSAAQYRTDSNH